MSRRAAVAAALVGAVAAVAAVASVGVTACARWAPSGAPGPRVADVVGDARIVDAQIDDASVVAAAVPVEAALRLGWAHGCALDAEGGLACWGGNTRGQLGDGTTEDRATPVRVAGIDRVVRVALGDEVTCAIDGGGAVWCWGARDRRRYGGGGVDVTRPVRVPGVEAAMRIAVGERAACAVTAAGALVCWGNEDYGERVPGAAAVPGRADDGPVRAVDVRADSQDNVCVLGEDRRVTCWGPDLGNWRDFDLPSSATPEDRQEWHRSRGTSIVVADDVDGFVEGAVPICVWRGDPAAWSCLDKRVDARLTTAGAGADLRGGGADLRGGGADLRGSGARVAVGWAHACAVEDGRVTCAGEDDAGQVGAAVTGGLEDVVRIAAASDHTCAQRAGGAIACWGSPRHFATGDASMALTPDPAAPAAAGRRTLALRGIASLTAANTARLCAIEPRGTVRCQDGARWRRMPGLRGVVELSAGDDHACARNAAGAVWCWGEWYFGPYNHDGDDGDFVRTRRPRRIVGLVARAIASDGEDDCAVIADGSIACWGRHHGKAITPVEAAPPATAGGDPIALALSSDWICAGDEGGTARCWAAGVALTDPPTFTMADIAELALAGERGCARQHGGQVLCWGRGPVGDGTWLPRATPVAVVGLTDAIQISVGVTHACARMAAGALRCWGENGEGQLGDGTIRDRLVPVAPIWVGDLGALAGVEAATLQRAHSSMRSHAATVVWTTAGEVWAWGEPW